MITLLYYSAHILPDPVAEKVREDLLKFDLPIISVTQKPLNLGKNICVGEIGQSYYNCYKQILTGLREVRTEFVACCEDDTLYNAEHFEQKPKEISYNQHMYYLEKDRFWHKGQTGMFACVAPTKLLLKALEERFELFPDGEPLPRRSQRHFWHEPGKTDGLKSDFFKTTIPLITFNYFAGLGGKATSSTHPEYAKQELEYWGKAKLLKNKYWDDN